ncbi:MAG: ISNCY family transposase [Rhodobacteraceae bacterium]|nr:ISNCY family transposase [Paracoccaceae bacterium]
MHLRRFDQLIERWRVVAAGLPDARTGDNWFHSLADIASAAFAVFFTQCPSFLSFQQNMEKRSGRNNARSLFHIERIPCDNHIRQMLDPIKPAHLFDFFDDLHQGFADAGLLEAMRAVQQTRLIALDATWYFSSQSGHIHCPNCSCIRHADGKTTHFHSAITPVIVSPGHAQVVPLRPEFITPQDGQAKQDCEINAAKRWLAAHAARYSTGNDTLLGDDLYAHQPFCRQVLLHGFHFLFTCKPASHVTLHQWVDGLEPGRQLHPLKLRVKGKSNHWEHHQYRWANGVPLTDSDDALKVNWCELTVTDGAGTVLYRNSFITDWEITAANVAGLVAAGRARWKIENENNNVLKTKGYHLEHNFGHGKQHLSSLLLTLNLLAFALHTFLEVTDPSYQLVRAAVGARRKFFTHLEAVTAYWFFESWERLMDFMMRGQEVGPYAAQKA